MSYEAEYSVHDGSLLRNKLAQQSAGNEGANHAASESSRKFAPRFSTWLRSFQFGHVITRFNAARVNSATHRKARFIIYAVPTTFAFIGAVSNFFSQSLTIYLRYQAMVDEYYFKNLQLQTAPAGITVARE